MSQNVTTECHTFSNLWYKATFTFYVWIGLGMALKLKKRGWFTQTPYTTRCDTLWPRRIVGPVFKWICHIYASYTLCFPAWTASSAHNWWHHSYFPPSPAWQYPAHCHSGLPDGAESARGGDNVVYWKEPNWRSIRILRWHRVLVLRSIYLYHLPAPLPDNFIIIVPVVSVWIVLFSDKWVSGWIERPGFKLSIWPTLPDESKLVKNWTGEPMWFVLMRSQGSSAGSVPFHVRNAQDLLAGPRPLWCRCRFSCFLLLTDNWCLVSCSPAVWTLSISCHLTLGMVVP